MTDKQLESIEMAMRDAWGDTGLEEMGNWRVRSNGALLLTGKAAEAVKSDPDGDLARSVMAACYTALLVAPRGTKVLARQHCVNIQVHPRTSGPARPTEIQRLAAEAVARREAGL